MADAAVGGALLTGVSFGPLIFVPVNFSYWEFALVIALYGFGSGLFFSPNWAEMMNAVPADRRGAAGGMIATFQNSANAAVELVPGRGDEDTRTPGRPVKDG